MAMKSTNIFSFTSSPLIYLMPDIQHLTSLHIRKILVIVYEIQGEKEESKES